MSAKNPTKAQLLRALNAIHALLEASHHGKGDGNVWETMGAIQYWTEETLGKEVATMRKRQREAMERLV